MSGWIMCSERTPHRKDGDKWGDVLTTNANEDLYVIAWYDVIRATEEEGMSVTHWRTPPKPPKGGGVA